MNQIQIKNLPFLAGDNEGPGGGGGNKEMEAGTDRLGGARVAALAPGVGRTLSTSLPTRQAANMFS